MLICVVSFTRVTDRQGLNFEQELTEKTENGNCHSVPSFPPVPCFGFLRLRPQYALDIPGSSPSTRNGPARCRARGLELRISSGFAPAELAERQDPQVIKAEIAAARKRGAQGLLVFHRDHLYNEHLTAIQEAVEAGKPAPESK